MRRVLLLSSLAVTLLFGAVNQANAGYLTSVMTSGVSNTFEDGSRETFFDLQGVGEEGHGVFSVGDVIAGFVEIRRVNSVDNNSPTHIYAVFSQQVASVVTATGDVFFTPTTASGLTLADLTGQAQPATGFFAVYTNAAGFGTAAGGGGQGVGPTADSLLGTPPAVSVASPADSSIKDYTLFIANNGLRELVIGVNPAQGGIDPLGPSSTKQDYFHADATTLGQLLFSPVIGLPLINSLTTGNSIASADFGLSVLVAPAGVTFGNTGFGSTGQSVHIELPGPIVIQQGFEYQALLSSASARGASNDPLYDFYKGNGNDFTNAVGGFQNNGTFQLSPTFSVVPEPGSIALFGMFSVAGFVWYRRDSARRRKE